MITYARDNVEYCSELARNMSELITIFNSSDLNEVQQTFYLARSTLVNFFKSRPTESTFDFMMNNLKIEMEKCNKLMLEMKNLKMEFKIWSEVKQITLFKLDYNIKQHLEQIHFEFVINAGNDPLNSLSDPEAKQFWMENFGTNVRKKKKLEKKKKLLIYTFLFFQLFSPLKNFFLIHSKKKKQTNRSDWFLMMIFLRKLKMTI